MSVVLTFRCDHQVGTEAATLEPNDPRRIGEPRATQFTGAGRCPWVDDSFSYAAAGDGGLEAAVGKLLGKGWTFTGGQLLCPDHNPGRNPNPITEISVQIPPKT